MSLEIKATPNQPNADDVLWKYMSFHKFVSFMTTKSFVYSRLDQLEDLWEGVNQQYLALSRFHDDNINNGFDPNHPFYSFWFDKSGKRSKAEKQYMVRQKSNFVMCWIINKRESAAMWNLYSEVGGVVIKMKYDTLRKVLIEPDNRIDLNDNIHRRLTLGKVEYKDFSQGYSSLNKDFLVKDTIYRKDLSFEHEHEFRVNIRLDNPLRKDKNVLTQQIRNFESVFFEIVAHPKTPSWQMRNLQSIAEILNFKQRIQTSDLRFR
jgi:hypothetical protein